MRAVFAGLALLAVALAGCTGAEEPPATPPGDGIPPGDGAGPGPGGNGNAPPSDPGQPWSVPAPWWALGDQYTLRITRAGEAGEGSVTHPLVNFLNDTETDHFWLGVEDRTLAMQHAMFDTNPFLGRIHHGILSPHEQGIHAGMYSFPLEDGKRWNGFFFGRNWTFLAREGPVQAPGGAQERGFRIEGTSIEGDGATVRLNYVPSIRWFSHLEEADASGTFTLEVEVTDHERGATGTYVFLRGRDLYQGPAVGGPHQETFQVEELLDSLAFHADLTAEGPLRVDLIDPDNAVRHTFQAADGRIQGLEEISPVAPGEWKVLYVGLGDMQGTVLVTGLLETQGSV